MTVFAVNKPNDKRFDITPAMQYGDIRYVNFRYIYGDEIDNERLPDEPVQGMRENVERFNPEVDYLLILGDHLQLVQFTAMLATAYGQFRVLRYDREARGYFPVVIDGSACLKDGGRLNV